MSLRKSSKMTRIPFGLKIGAVSLVMGLLPALAAAQIRLPSTTTIRGTTTAAPTTTINTAPVVGSTTVSPTTITNTGSAPAVLNTAALISAPTTTTVTTSAAAAQPITVSSPSIVRYDTVPVSVVSAPTTQPTTNTTYVAVLPEPCLLGDYINIFNYSTFSRCHATGTTSTMSAPSVYTPPATTSTTRTATAPISEQLTASALTPCRTLDYVNVFAYRTMTNCYGSGFQEAASSSVVTAPTPVSETVTRITAIPVASTGSDVLVGDIRAAAISAVTASVAGAQPSVQAAAPVISNIRATNVSEQSVTISWDTDRSTSGFIDYGATSIYGKTQVSSSNATSHQAVLSDFVDKGSQTFHFRIRVRDAQGLESVSSDQVVQVVTAAVKPAATAGSSSASAPEAAAPQMSVETVMKGLQGLSSVTTRLLTPEERSALGFPFRASVQVKTITSARSGTRTVFNYTDVTEDDADFDGLPDDLEAKLGTDEDFEDTDGDGKSDGYEYYISKTDPTEAD
jgi:hypothetical protein